MAHIIQRTVFTIIFFVLSFVPALTSAEIAKVKTRKNAIREDCRFFSPVKINVAYNDVIEVLSPSGDWYRVTFRNVTGCIHKSAIETKAFSLSRLWGTETRDTSSDEVALAGKGFNPQVESSYKRKYPDLNFELVDTIEAYGVPEKTLRSFIDSGRLNSP